MKLSVLALRDFNESHLAICRGNEVWGRGSRIAFSPRKSGEAESISCGEAVHGPAHQSLSFALTVCYLFVPLILRPSRLLAPSIALSTIQLYCSAICANEAWRLFGWYQHHLSDIDFRHTFRCLFPSIFDLLSMLNLGNCAPRQILLRARMRGGQSNWPSDASPPACQDAHPPFFRLQTCFLELGNSNVGDSSSRHFPRFPIPP